MSAVPASASEQNASALPPSVEVDGVEVPILRAFAARSTDSTRRYEMVGGAIHGVQRIAGATVLYASVGFPAGADTDRFVADHFFSDLGGTGYPLYATMRMALVDREGRRSYWPLMTDMSTYFSTRKSDLRSRAGELRVVWGVFPELPASVTHVDVVLGDVRVLVPGVEVGEGLLEPVVDDPAPLLGTGWPRITEQAAIAEADQAHTVFDLSRRTKSPGGEASTTESVDEVTTTLDANVLFDKSSAALTPAAQDVLAAVAEDLVARGAGQVVVTGHTDSDGSSASNDELSRRRAASVVAVLQPAAGTRVTFVTEGKGEGEPVAPNDSPENMQLNRRVTVQYSIDGEGR